MEVTGVETRDELLAKIAELENELAEVKRERDQARADVKEWHDG